MNVIIIRIISGDPLGDNLRDLDIEYVFVGHRFGNQSGPCSSSRTNQAAILRRIVFRVYFGVLINHESTHK